MQQAVNTAKKMAAFFRVDLGLSLTEPVDMTKVIMKTGISLLKTPLQGSISGLYLRADSVKVILINSTKSMGHQNFTLAHELYHAQCEEQRSRAYSAKQSERLANTFASFFLMPERGVIEVLNARKAIESPGIGDIIYLEQFYSVSHAAMLCHLTALRIIDNHKAKAVEHGVIGMAQRLGYGDALYKPTNERSIISDYAEKAKEAHDTGLITDTRYQELLAEIGLAQEILADTDDVK